MTVSPFTPLFFLHDHKTDGLESCYLQTFSTTDRILVEIFIDGFIVPPIYVNSEPSSARLFSPSIKSVKINDSMTLVYCLLTFNPGIYSVEIKGYGKSEPFRVTDDMNILGKTTLIQYSMKNNRQRNDAMFFINGIQHYFDFRVPGGFKDGGWAFSVESEQFTTPFGDISQLYGLETTQKTFTLGCGCGVPIWFGEMLNRILVCSHVYFDGVRYTRKDTNVPEANQLLEGTNSFVFTQVLQQCVNLDPTLEAAAQTILRRVDSDSFRLVTNDIYRKI